MGIALGQKSPRREKIGIAFTTKCRYIENRIGLRPWENLDEALNRRIFDTAEHVPREF